MNPNVTFITTEEYHAQNLEPECEHGYFLITLSEFYRPFSYLQKQYDTALFGTKTALHEKRNTHYAKRI